MFYRHIYLVYPCKAVRRAAKNDNVIYLRKHLMISHQALEENYPIVIAELARQGNAVIGDLDSTSIWWFHNAQRYGKLNCKDRKTQELIQIPVTLIYPDPAYGVLWKNELKDMVDKNMFSHNEELDYFSYFDGHISRFEINQSYLHGKRSIEIFPGLMYSGDPKDLDLMQIIRADYNISKGG